jgi:hypothetical protein
MVGHLILDQQIGVRIPAPQPPILRKTARDVLYLFQRTNSCPKTQAWHPHTQLSIIPYPLICYAK